MSNNEAETVRKSAAAAADDPRSYRSRVALGNALVALMLERRFDDISVQQVLDRAKVGRATFYAHFRNKHDLLFSDAERFLDMLEGYFERREGPGSRRVAPVAELFAHVADYEAFQRALARAGLREAVYDLVAGHLARLIERRIALLRPDAAAGGRGALSLAVTSRVFAGALVELLRWWLDRPARHRPSARQMDEQFHEIVWRGLQGSTA